MNFIEPQKIENILSNAQNYILTCIMNIFNDIWLDDKLLLSFMFR